MGPLEKGVSGELTDKAVRTDPERGCEEPGNGDRANVKVSIYYSLSP